MDIAIVGAGKMGQKVANALLGGDHSVTVIDPSEKTLQKLALQMDIMTVVGNGKQVSVLKDLQISHFDFLLALTGNDELNITIAAFAKKLGCKQVIARVREPEHMDQFDFIKSTMGIDFLVNPDMAISNEIYKYLVEKYTLANGVFTTGKAALIEFKAKHLPQVIDKPISDVAVMPGILDNMLIVAISRNGKVIVPHGDAIIRYGDALYVIGEQKPIMELNKTVHEKGTYTGLQKVMVIGGGKTGLYLAKKLSRFGVSVKLIERDLARCHYLAEKLDNVIILHGDATDANLLEEENIKDMDGFVTATGFDEDNILLALMAKSFGIEDVIAKVSRGIYTELVSTLGVDMALNPIDIITSNILKIVRGKTRVISSQLVQGQAEITEIIATSKMPISGKPLRDLNLPSSLLIGAIHRGTEIIIPKGDTVIQNGDRILIFSLLSDLSILEKFTK